MKSKYSISLYSVGTSFNLKKSEANALSNMLLVHLAKIVVAEQQKSNNIRKCQDLTRIVIRLTMLIIAFIL